MGSTAITEAEWEVMDELWRDSPLTSSQIVKRLEQRTAWKPKTVKSLLSRLVKKECVTFQQEGNRYLYGPAISREQAVGVESRSFLDRVFRGDAASMLLHFVERTELQDEEVEKLRRLLDEKEPT